MLQEYQILNMVEKIEVLRLTAEKLKEISGGIPAVDRNADRMLACIRLLELDVTDVVDILYEKDQKPVSFESSEKVTT